MTMDPDEVQARIRAQARALLSALASCIEELSTAVDYPERAARKAWLNEGRKLIEGKPATPLRRFALIRCQRTTAQEFSAATDDGHDPEAA